MVIRRLIGRLLAVVVIAGLFAAPLMASAKQLAAAGMTDMSGHQMSGDMPCCPDVAGHGKGCQDCPLMAMCTLTFAQAEPPAAATMPVTMPILRQFSVSDDLFADGLIGTPPDHPPRLLI